MWQEQRPLASAVTEVPFPTDKRQPEGSQLQREPSQGAWPGRVASGGPGLQGRTARGGHRALRRDEHRARPLGPSPPPSRHLGATKALSAWGRRDFLLCVNQLISHVQRHHHLTKELFSIRKPYFFPIYIRFKIVFVFVAREKTKHLQIKHIPKNVPGDTGQCVYPECKQT